MDSKNLFPNAFLGEFPLTPEDPEYAEYAALNSPASLAMLFISTYGGFDGAHHKDWVLDQVSRVLMGTPVVFSVARWANGMSDVRFHTGEPSAEYLQWVDVIRGDTYEDGSREFDYDVGIAP